MLRVEARNAETPIERKPSWIRTTAKMGPEYTALHSMVKSEGLHTVCQEAGCPNIFECWEDREATFLIGQLHAVGVFVQPAPVNHLAVACDRADWAVDGNHLARRIAQRSLERSGASLRADVRQVRRLAAAGGNLLQFVVHAASK
jgi:hypothetical protein